jgi:hypothetical protein
MPRVNGRQRAERSLKATVKPGSVAVNGCGRTHAHVTQTDPAPSQPDRKPNRRRTAFVHFPHELLPNHVIYATI